MSATVVMIPGADDKIGKILLVEVGTEEWVASVDDMLHIRQAVTDAVDALDPTSNVVVIVVPRGVQLRELPVDELRVLLGL